MPGCRACVWVTTGKRMAARGTASSPWFLTSTVKAAGSPAWITAAFTRGAEIERFRAVPAARPATPRPFARRGGQVAVAAATTPSTSTALW